MELSVHNVGHGLCISLLHQNGNAMLWDCGHQDDYRPSDFLSGIGITKVDYFFVTNYDEDHFSDLPLLRQNIRLRSMYRNKSISGDQLRQLKLQGGPVSTAMESMLDMIQSFTGGPLSPAPEFPDVRFKIFNNSYSNDFPDTNNISLVTFLECKEVKFVFPGDLEKKGWLSLLQDKDFIAELADVNIFVAPHHGRENGYCQDVFDYCNPDVIIFSDSSIKHATQEMSQTYGGHAKGITFNGAPRKVLSTRNDGTLTWTIS